MALTNACPPTMWFSSARWRLPASPLARQKLLHSSSVTSALGPLQGPARPNRLGHGASASRVLKVSNMGPFAPALPVSHVRVRLGRSVRLIRVPSKLSLFFVARATGVTGHLVPGPHALSPPGAPHPQPFPALLFGPLVLARGSKFPSSFTLRVTGQMSGEQAHPVAGPIK